MVAMAALLAAVERVALPPSTRSLLQILVTAGGFSCIGLWIRWNRAAIALDEWDGRNVEGPASSSLLVRVYDPWLSGTDATSAEGPRGLVGHDGDLPKLETCGRDSALEGGRFCGAEYRPDFGYGRTRGSCGAGGAEPRAIAAAGGAERRGIRER